MNPLLRIRDLRVALGGKEVLCGISIEVGRGDFLSIVGPNGAGKTTLFGAILGTVRPSSGEIRWSPARPRIGYLPQRDEADPVWPLTPRDLVRLARAALHPWGRLGETDEAAASRALDRAGIANLAPTPLRDLSGGQFQRALLARALAVEPELLILDEPTRGMDRASLDALLRLLAEWNREGLTILLVTHDLEVAHRATRRTVVLEEGRFSEAARGFEE